MTDFGSLSTRVSGPVLLPGDEGYADEVAGFISRVSHHPDAVVGATSAADVAATVRFARENALTVRVLATGHGSSAQVEGGILVRTSRLDSIEIDGNLATIGAGVRWKEVIAAAAPLGLAPIAGSSDNVGVVGYLAGGGLGPLARSHGFSSDYVRGFTVVDGTGEVLEVDSSSNPDLFWALRGGKGGLGIVISVTIELVELDMFYAGSLMFDGPDIETALRGWVAYTSDAPDDVTTSAVLLRFPPFEQVPPPLRGRTLLSLRFAYPGDLVRGELLAAPLRLVAPVYLDSLGPLAVADVATIHGDPTEPSPGWTAGMTLDALDQDFASAVLGDVGFGLQTPLMAVEVRHIGGATSTDVPGGSAVGGRGAEFVLGIVAMAPVPEALHAVQGAAAALVSSLEPWVREETTINFFPATLANPYTSSWSPSVYERLAAIRLAHDPDHVFPYGPSV